MLQTPSGALVPKHQYHTVELITQRFPERIFSYPDVAKTIDDIGNQYSDVISSLIIQLDNEKNAELKEKDNQIQNILAQLTETNNRFLDYAKEKDVQFQVQLQQKDDQLKAQLKEKDEQICRLHDIISKMQTENTTPHPPPCEEDDIQMDQNIFISPQMPPKTEENTKSSIVVTNIPETMTDDDGKTVLTDIQIMEKFIQNVDQNAKVISVKRMGKKDTSKNRPIQVSFKTKNEKNDVLKNAPVYIKSNDKLKEWKVFVNNYESPAAHKIQVKLTKKKDQLYKARGGNASIKYFIKEKQIFVHNTVTNETKPVECDENIEAAQFYKRNQKSSQKETKNNLSS